MNILKKRVQDLTVSESLGLSLGIMVLSWVPYAIVTIAEGGYFEKKEKDTEPPEEITAIDEEEETSD